MLLKIWAAVGAQQIEGPATTPNQEREKHKIKYHRSVALSFIKTTTTISPSNPPRISSSTDTQEDTERELLRGQRNGCY